MTGGTPAFAVARLDDIEEIGDGLPCRPVRHHFGIASFGVNAWTGAAAGDRILNEHDEAGDAEELYLVHRGRAASSWTATASTRRRARWCSRGPG
jgi:hypothetical protein